MMSNYPPGVTGLEYEIAGPDSETEEERFCPKCEKEQSGFLQTYRNQGWWTCDECNQTEDINMEEW